METEPCDDHGIWRSARKASGSGEGTHAISFDSGSGGSLGCRWKPDEASHRCTKRAPILLLSGAACEVRDALRSAPWVEPPKAEHVRSRLSAYLTALSP